MGFRKEDDLSIYLNPGDAQIFRYLANTLGWLTIDHGIKQDGLVEISVRPNSRDIDYLLARALGIINGQLEAKEKGEKYYYRENRIDFYPEAIGKVAKTARDMLQGNQELTMVKEVPDSK